jgi:hypothetical protein
MGINQGCGDPAAPSSTRTNPEKQFPSNESQVNESQ